MKCFVSFVFLAGLVAFTEVGGPTVRAQDGPLDPTFGDGGTLTLSLGSPEGTSAAADVIVQPDGKIVAGGYSVVDGETLCTLVRLLPDGTLDGTFGEGGMTQVAYEITPDEGECRIQTLVRQQTGRILALLESYSHYVVLGFTPSGYLDSKFGAGGVARRYVSRGYGSAGTAHGIAVNASGSVLVVGTVVSEDIGADWMEVGVSKWRQDGSVEGAFGDDGVTIQGYGGSHYGNHAMAVGVNEYGKILITGHHRENFQRRIAIGRWRANGSRDPSFGSDGHVIIAHPGNSSATALTILPDGKVVVAGYVNETHLALVRLLPDGAPDPSFGVGGAATFSLESYVASDLAVLPGGTHGVAISRSTYSANHRFRVAVVREDGSLLGTFGEGGVAEVPFGSEKARALGIAVQPDGRVVAVGEAAVDGHPVFALARFSAASVVASEEGPDPSGTDLLSLHPNPSRGLITIPFALAEAGRVSLSVFDVLGREVLTLTEGTEAPGMHHASFDTTSLPAGTYVVRLLAGGHVRTQTVTVLR